MQVAVIGLGRFGSHIAETMAKAGVEVIAVDKDRALVERIRDKVTAAIAFDATDEEELRFHGLDKVSVAVVAIGDNFEANLLTTVILKKALKVEQVVSRVASRMQGKILREIGADTVVNPEDEAAERWANRLLTPHIIDHIELAEGYGLVQMVTPADWANKTLAELNVRLEHHVNIVAIKRKKTVPNGEGEEKIIERILDVPLPTSKLEAEDILILAGRESDLEALPH